MKGKLLSIAIFLIGFSSAFCQSITGPVNVQPGEPAYYEAHFPHVEPYANISWTVTGGSIYDQNIDPEAGPIYCFVEWDVNPGTGSLYITEDVEWQYAELFVTIGSPINPGYIYTANTFFNYLNPISISQLPPTGGDCGGAYNYFWEYSVDENNWTVFDGGQSFPALFSSPYEKIYIRRSVGCNGQLVSSDALVFNYRSANWENRNYIRTNEMLYPGKKSFMEANDQLIGIKQQSTIFFDGLGRPEQNVITAASPNNKDLVRPVEYDALGRETKKHLAYQATTSDGKFKTTALADQQSFMATKYPGEGTNNFFTKTELEESPLNRSVKALAPGLNWVGSNKGISTGYELNKPVDAVRIWKIDNFLSTALPVSGAADIYPENTLYKTTTTDERGKRIIDYKDKDGMVILRKQQEKNAPPDLDEAHKGWLCTYYVYDDFGRLRYMITPNAVRQMVNWVMTTQIADGLCYKYVYDGRGRLIEKKLPDALSQYMVYDSRDRLVFSQDGNQRAGKTNSFAYKEWSFFLYDAQNRQLATGTMLDATSNYTQASLQTLINNPTYNFEIRTITLQTDISETVVAFNPVPLFAGGATITNYQVKTNSVNYYDNNQATYSNITTPYASNFENMDAQSPSVRATGLLTGTKVRVLNGGNTFLKSTTIYDEKGRVLQVANKNVLNYTIVNTNQYDFAGKLRASVYDEQNTSSGYVTIISKYEFDHTGRLKKTIKKVSQKLNSTASVFNTGERTVAELAYDELGQLQSKTLAPGYSGPNGAYMEKLDYEYNIRGWMTGINKAYSGSTVATGRFFGMELGYDKPGNAAFTNTILNGNVAGIAWKTAGNNIVRKFDYQYDNANRLILADFNQKNTPGAASWTKDKFNFSVPVINYDANGNIVRMEQQGVNFAGIVAMDKMTYGYDTYSNKLKWVAEDAGVIDHKLGDFTDKNTGLNNIDYTYDENGNLNKDNNKGINNIKYNYLNLPELIDVPGKGTIAYVYDAAGNKLQKIVTDNTPTTGQLITTTSYSGPVVYPGNDLYISFEEGRVRNTKNIETNLPTGLTIDYFIKDHLGNIRMVLTEETQLNTYPEAKMETARTALEDKFYKISNRTDRPAELTAGNAQYDLRYGQKMSKLSTVAGNSKIGPSILLKVMAGDLLQVKTDYYYKDNGTQVNTVSVLSDLVSNLLVHLNAGQAGATAKNQSGIIGPSVQNNAVTQSVVTQQNTDYISTKPKAFINYIVFDEQFNAVSKGVKQVQNSGPLQPTLLMNDIPVSQNGWIYVFVNNESQQPVYFDNFQVLHTRGNLLEETHYYPFGLAMKAISSRALSINPVNKHKFGDKELQSEEFSDGTSLEEYDFGARYYDPQTGRWNSLDPQADEFPNASPYSYGGNNPVLFADKDGKFIHLILKYGINVGINIGIQMITAYMFDPNVKSWGDAWGKASVWDALWESAGDMIGSRSLRMAGDGIMGMFHYMDDVGFRNITGAGLANAGFMGILEPLVYKYIGKYGAAAVEKGLKKIGIDQAAINKFLGRKPSAPKIDLKAGKTFSMTRDGKKFSPGSYRQNLKTLTGSDGAGMDAHHIFSKGDSRFTHKFEAAGIDVNDPIYMQWWKNGAHQSADSRYREEWNAYFNLNPFADKSAILDFGKSLMSKYGLSTFY